MGRREFIKVIGGATDIPIEQPTKFDLPSISAQRAGHLVGRKLADGIP